MVGKIEGKPENWGKARKKDLTMKSPEGDKDQDLLSGTEGGVRIKVAGLDVELYLHNQIFGVGEWSVGRFFSKF